MIYEFILKVREHPKAPLEKIGYNIVKEDYYKTQLSYFENVGSQYCDHIVLINKLNDNGEFIEVIK